MRNEFIARIHGLWPSLAAHDLLIVGRDLRELGVDRIDRITGLLLAELPRSGERAMTLLDALRQRFRALDKLPTCRRITRV